MKKVGTVVGDRDPQLVGVLDGGRIVGEVDRGNRGGTRRVVVPVLGSRGDRLGVGLRLVVRLVDHAGEGSGVGAVLDLDAVPEEPAEVDTEADHAHEDGEHQPHHDEDDTRLFLAPAAGAFDR